ncbi:unnamed protein product, partial [Ectocarpus sp. 12 AP-2014]
CVSRRTPAVRQQAASELTQECDSEYLHVHLFAVATRRFLRIFLLSTQRTSRLSVLCELYKTHAACVSGSNTLALVPCARSCQPGIPEPSACKNLQSIGTVLGARAKKHRRGYC